MPLYYVTGTPGSGKSTAMAELQRRRYEAHDTDNYAAYYDIRTGQKVTSGRTAAERTPEFRRLHEWRIPVEKIQSLARDAANKAIFLCGIVANDADFWHLFDGVFCLYVPPDQLEQRLVERPDNNDYGKNAHELADALHWAAYAKQQYTDLGAVIIDATQRPTKVVDDILAQVAEA